MNKFAWIVGVTCLGLAGYVLLSDAAASNAPGADDVDEVGERVGQWGTKQRASGVGRQLGGRLKEGAGWATADRGLQGEGAVDELTGKVKNAAGKAAHAVSDEIADLNR